MKKIIYLGISLIFSCNDGDEILGSCYISPDPDMICTEEYNPVCACNNLVYGNSCKAEKAGNLHYKSTHLDAGEECNY
tara:strand:- start:223 stop:456 length:234 start_codon:yes stop_codon:yes gene_type:complete